MSDGHCHAAALALSLDRLASTVADGVRETDLQPGDWLVIRTKNSTYLLRVNGDGTFDATGGWFSQHPEMDPRQRIAGCTWGGTALLTRMVAAPGMFLEFATGIRTTRIREVRHVRPTAGLAVH